MNYNWHKYIFLITIFISSTFLIHAQSSHNNNTGINIYTNLDEPAAEMGQPISLHVEITGALSKDGRILLPDTLWKEIEIADAGIATIADLGNGVKSLKQDILIRGFEPGVYILAPVLYYQDDEIIASKDVQTLQIIDALPLSEEQVDSITQPINDYFTILEPERKFFDFIPDWIADYGLWILLGIILVAIFIFIYFYWIRKGEIPLLHKKVLIPPYELAIGKLEKLKKENLWERGLYKEYYTRLIDILRGYLDTRFNIQAMEMTSAQINESIKSLDLPLEVTDKIRDLLQISDFVKFAKVEPSADENIQSFKSVRTFVEETKPIDDKTTNDNLAENRIGTEFQETAKESMEDSSITSSVDDTNSDSQTNNLKEQK